MIDKSEGLTLFVTGGSGFIGRHLVEAWTSLSSEHIAIVQTRNPQLSSSGKQVLFVESFSQVKNRVIDVVVNLAGASIAQSRWTPSRKRELERSRVDLTARLVKDFADSPPRVVISASAIGFYGNGEELYDEQVSKGLGYAASLCDAWETEAQGFSRYSRLIIFRLGVVLGDGGALAKLLPVYRLGLGGPIGSGKQWFSWVHVADVVSAIITAIYNENWKGIYNLTAPEAVRQVEFARCLGRILHRPSVLPTPASVLRLIFGEMAQELLISGQRVTPQRLNDAGFEFQYPNIEPAISAVLSRSRCQ